MQLLTSSISPSISCTQSQTPSFSSKSLQLTGTDVLLKDGKNVCFGDFNSDSYIDIIYLVNNNLYLLENTINSFNHYQLTLDGSVAKKVDQFSCFDYNHNGIFNLLTISQGKMYVISNKNMKLSNYFLKLSGLIDCGGCNDMLPPATWANFKFYVSDEYGVNHGIAIGHSNIHLSLPYEWIGLGSITNYIPELSMTNYQTTTQNGIIPNSHLYFFNSQILLYLKMGDAYIVIAVLVASSLIIIGLIIWLHHRENREDMRSRMMSANRVLLRGL